MMNRCRTRIASAIAWGSAVVIVVSGDPFTPDIALRRVGWLAAVASRAVSRFGGVQFVQQLFDAVLAGDGLVIDEVQFGHALQPQPRPDLPAQEGRRPSDGALRVAARLIVAKHGEENPRRLQVGGYLDARDGDEADAGVVPLARQQLGQFTSDLIGDPVGSG